ncbi:MAG: hypothetical protein GX606_06460 [Elusimicrobia bacterium]|nr:hypothetical protein [Elusimicrobiota bacterium]
MKNVLSPNSRNFRAFGKIIEYPDIAGKGTRRNLWRIIHTENAKVGWRVAYLVLRDKTIGRMGRHPRSDETFEPIKGKALLFVSKDKRIEDIQCFLLDKPIILFKGIWHNVLTLTPEAHIKICENASVTQDNWDLGSRVSSIEELRNKIREHKGK